MGLLCARLCSGSAHWPICHQIAPHKLSSTHRWRGPPNTQMWPCGLGPIGLAWSPSGSWVFAVNVPTGGSQGCKGNTLLTGRAMRSSEVPQRLCDSHRSGCIFVSSPAWLPARLPSTWWKRQGTRAFLSSSLSPFSKNKLQPSPHLPPIFSCLTPMTLRPQMRPHVCPLLDRGADPTAQMLGARSLPWPLAQTSRPLQLCPSWEQSIEPAPGSGVGEGALVYNRKLHPGFMSCHDNNNHRPRLYTLSTFTSVISFSPCNKSLGLVLLFIPPWSGCRNQRG